jgi:phosphohistidine phosphatase
MKKLLLLRHAKSGYPEGVGDFERPLNGRGRDSAQRMGKYLAAAKLVPHYVKCSAAMRARQTLDHLCRGMGTMPTMVLEPKLYLASGRSMLKRLQRAPDDADRLMLIAHNPGIQNLALDLAGPNSGEMFQRLAAKYPTAGLAMFDCAIEHWSDLGPADCTLVDFVTPRQLLAQD